MSLTPSTKAPARSTTNRPAPVQTYLRSARLLAFSYAAVAVGAVLLPLNFPWREPLWLATVALGLVLGVHLARGHTGPRWLLVGCGWLLVGLALVLAFVVGDPLGLLGTVFAVPMLALLTGKVTPRTKKALVNHARRLLRQLARCRSRDGDAACSACARTTSPRCGCDHRVAGVLRQGHEGLTCTEPPQFVPSSDRSRS